ncbi:MAG: AAA family ATPase, partial [Gemmatimonadetes bacterium]|nr:AAA family ATPase [Gemmatimonadota bacterium]
MAQDRDFPTDEPRTHAGEGLPLRDLVAGIVRRWWVVLLALCGGVGIAGYLATREEPGFRSTATLWLPRPPGGNNSLGGLGSLMGIGGGGMSLSELEIFRSRAFSGEVVDSAALRLVGVDGSDALVEGVRVEPDAPAGPLELEFGDDDVVARAGFAQNRAPYGRPFRVRGVWMVVPRQPGVTSARFEVLARDHAIGRFQENFFVRQRDRTEMVDVGITASSPRAAERATNTAVDLFRAQRARNAAAEDEERGRRLVSQIAFTDASLRKAQGRLVATRTRAQTYSSGALFQAREAERIGLETKLEDLRQDCATYTALAEGLRAGAGQDRGIDVLIASPGVAARPLIGQLYGSLVEYQMRRDTMTAGRWGRSATHPDVRRLDQLIADTKTRLTGAVGSEVAALDAQIATAEGRRRETGADMAPLPAADARETELAREIEGLTRMSMMLREEYTRQQLATRADSIRVVDRALPGWEVNGGLVQMLVLGIFGGLVVGIGSASLLTVLDPTLRTLGDAERLLELPTLAVVPRERRRRAGLTALRGEGAEAYRTLRTNLRFSRVAPDARTLVVTSAETGEGRTTVAANLAATVARQGVRVLLVDCDLGRARLHPLFGVDRAPGLTDLLLGDVSAEAAVRATSVEGVFLLAAGTPVGRSASEVLEGGAVQGVIAELAANYDLLILDTPPLLTDTA